MSHRAASRPKRDSGIARLRKACGYSLNGLSAAYRHEDAFRQEVWLAVVLIPAALLGPAGALGKALMIASVLLVLIVELLNSAIEAVVDRVSLEDHALSGRAKDIGSAAVAIAILNAVAVWSLVLLN